MKRIHAKASNPAVRGYTGYLARNIRPAISEIGAQIAQLRATLAGFEMWLSWHGLAGQRKRSRRAAVRS